MPSETLPDDRGRIALVAAVGRNGVIGHQGVIPWRLSSDLKRFKALTSGHTIIMGRLTYLSIGKPLPGRRTIVVTSGNFDGVETAASLTEAVERADRPVFLVGGSAIYSEGMNLADTIHLTEVDVAPEGDAYFPPIDPEEFRLERRHVGVRTDRDEHPYAFATFRRIRDRRTVLSAS